MNRFCRFFLFLLVFSLAAVPAFASPASYDASTMRLLRHEGTVEIFDVNGESRFLLDNVRFISGESMQTGDDGLASVGLDDTKIVSLDNNTHVTFIQEAGHMQLNLMQGSIFLDVQEKLDENASFDIQTTTMTVGIRGTLIFADESDGSDDAPAGTTIGIMEGGGRVTFTDNSGSKRVMDVSAGNKIVIPKDAVSPEQSVTPVVSPLTSADMPAYVTRQVLADDTLTNRVTEGSENGAQLLLGSSGGEEEGDYQELYPADGDWTWGDKVSIVAQSASKLYDGKPLMRPSDALVYGLPGNFNIEISCSGSITNVGTTDNVVSSYSISNGSGQNVTAHFTNVEKIAGTLVVDPAPLIVWTGSAEKVYDGEPLTCADAEIRTVPGHVSEDPAWKNTSLVTETALGSEKMVALSGHTFVHGTNPLTGQTQELELKAGQSLSVCLHDAEDGQSLEFEIVNLKEEDIPEEVLRVYADNPALLAQACLDTGWDPDLMASLIAALPPLQESKVVSDTGIKIAGESEDDLMTDSTNVRIHIDTQITNYSTRALTGEEASFTPIVLDPSIVITATGSQTEVGESANTYTIDWGTADKNNFVLREDLGTLVVTPQNDAEITITAPSASKVYDGKSLTADGYVIVKGLPEGYTARVSTDGSITKVGTAKNEVTYYRFLNKDGEDVTREFSNVTVKDGTLTVQALSLDIDCGGSTVSYSGTAFVPQPVLTYLNGTHTGETVTGTQVADKTDRAAAGYLAAAGGALRRTRAETISTLKYVFTLFTGDTVELALTGMGTDAGTYTLAGTVTSSLGNSIKTNLTGAQFTISPAEVTVTSGSAKKIYDGSPLTCDEITVTGMPDGQTLTVTATGTLTDPGTAENTFTVNFGDLKPDNYTVTKVYGTLTVTEPEAVEPIAVTITSGSAEKIYDGAPLTSSEVTVTGLPDGQSLSVTATGTITDVGTARNTFTVNWGDLNPDDYTVTEEPGTLTVTTAAVAVTSGSAEKVYDGTPLTSSDVTVTGLPDGQSVSVTATGTITDAGTAQNTFTVDWGDLSPDNYTVTETVGTLTVTKRAVTLTSADDSKTYDGSPLTNETITVGGDGFVEGEGAAYTFASDEARVDAGESENKFTYTLIEGTKADNYDISTVFGTLTMEPLPLNVNLGGGTFEYLHTTSMLAATLSCNGTSISGDIEETGDGYYYIFNLPTDDSVTISSSGYDPEAPVGTYHLTGSASFTGKASNYTVSYTGNSVTITKCPITITTENYSKLYDGLPGPENTAAAIIGDNWEGISVSEAGSDSPDAGTHDNKPSITWGDADPDNYAVTYELGTITIDPRNITLTSADDSKVYDGTPLTNNNVSVGGYDFAPGEGASYSFTGSQTDVGTSPNAFTYTLNDGTKASNYIIAEPVFGTLEVTPGTMTVTAVTYSGVYDGEAHSGGASCSVTDGTTIQYSTDGGSSWSSTPPSITNVGTVNYTVNATNPNYSDATASGSLEVTPGTMTVTAVNYSGVYDGEAHSGGASCSVTDGTTIQYSTDGGSSWSSTPPSITLVGTVYYTVKATNPNYIDATASGTLEVAAPAAPTMNLTAVNFSGVYDGTTHSGGATCSVTDGTTIMYSTDGGSTWTGYVPSITNVGVINYKVKATNPNYSDAIADGVLEVTPAELSVTAINYHRSYDGETHSGGATPSIATNTVIQYSTDGGSTWSNTAPTIKDIGTVNYMVKATNTNASNTATAEGKLQVVPIYVNVYTGSYTYASQEAFEAARSQILSSVTAKAYNTENTINETLTPSYSLNGTSSANYSFSGSAFPVSVNFSVTVSFQQVEGGYDFSISHSTPSYVTIQYVGSIPTVKIE